jgi:tetratricopeptide (TPR) repeat protein
MENEINRNEMERPVNINLRDARNLRGTEMRRGFGAEKMPPSPVLGRGPGREYEEGSTGEKKDKKMLVKMLNRVIGLSIFAIFFGVPLYFTGMASQGIIFEKQIYFYFWLLLGLVVWVAKGVITGELDIRRTSLDIPILGVWLAVGLATIFSVDRWHSFWGAFSDPSRGFMSVTAYIIAYYLILSNFNAKRLKLILTAILSSGGVLIVWTTLAILNIKFLPNSLAQYAPLSLAGSVTTLGVIFAALVPIITTVILKYSENNQTAPAKKKIYLGGLLLMLLLDLFLILALYNYVPWLAFFVGIVIFLVFILAQIVRPKESWTWLPMVVFILAMVLRMTGAVTIARVNLPMELSLNYTTSAAIAKTSLTHKPWLGSGPATYGYDFSLNRPQDFNLNAFYNLRFFQGTGVFMEAATTLGIIGTILLAILVLAYIGLQFHLVAKDKEKNKLYSLGAFSAASIFLLTVLLDRSGGVELLLAVLFITLALAVAFLESEREESYLSLSLKASPKFALALAFVFMVVCAGVAFLFVFLGKVYAADVMAGQAALTFNKNQTAALTDMGKAISLNPLEAQYYTQIGQYYMALANQEAMKDQKTRDVDKIKQYLNFSIQATTQAESMNPNDVGSVESLALIYENAGLYVPDSLKLADQYYQAAQKLEPHNPVYDIKLGQLAISQAASGTDKNAAKAALVTAQGFFQKAVAEKNNYADAYYQLALDDEALNQMDQAIANGQQAVQLNPQNSNYLLAMGRFYQERNASGDAALAEQYYQADIALNDSDINGHFYLGLFYEKQKEAAKAKEQYNQVIALLQKGSNNDQTIAQVQKMITNVDNGVANTPESLGLVQQNNASGAPADNAQATSAPANTPTPTLNETKPADNTGKNTVTPGTKTQNVPAANATTTKP